MSEPTIGNMTISQLKAVITEVVTEVILTVDLNNNPSFKEMRSNLSSRIDRLEEKVDDQFATLAHNINRRFEQNELAQNNILNVIGEKHTEFNRRLLLLEQT